MHGARAQRAHAFFHMGKWDEALAALDEHFHTKRLTAYIYHYNRAIFLVSAGRISASQEAYSEFQKQLEQLPKVKLGKNTLYIISEQYRLLLAFQKDNNETSLREYLDFLPTTFYKPPTLMNKIALNYYQGLYELHYGDVQQAMSHFDFILKTESTAWYRNAAQTERQKLL